MGVRSVVRGLLSDDELYVLIECRQCGKTVPSETDTCPACGATAFCRYEIPE
jgi:rRNA maturation endonuclease Nob1